MTGKRHLLARVGIVFLNILAPGLGLLRLGRWHIAALLYGLTLAVLLFMRFGPLAPFPVWALFMLLAIVVLLTSMVASWIFSRGKEGGLQPWRRWYTIAAVALLSFGINWFLLDENKIAYRNFYLPAEGMSPTLLKGDRMVVYMRQPQDLRRGDVVLVRTGRGDIYVKRVAGLPGDRIGVSNGMVALNGVPMNPKLVAIERVEDGPNLVPARRLDEQFPGEVRPHQIYDLDDSAGDEFGPVFVRPGHYFLLGDHRDRSADSRFAHEEFGLEQVKAQNILGRPLFYSWGSSRPIGTSIVDRP